MECNEASVRQFNWRSVSASSVLRSNQTATVCLWPSYHLVTVSLFYRPYRRTTVWIVIKLVHLTVWSSRAFYSRQTSAAKTLVHDVSRHLARLPNHLPVSYYLADAVLSASPSAVHLPVCSPGSCGACRRLSAGHQHCPHLPSTAHSPFAGTRSLPGHFRDAEKQLRSIVRCSHGLISMSKIILSTCCLMKMAAASSLDRIRMKTAHRVLQPSVTVGIHFFWF